MTMIHYISTSHGSSEGGRSLTSDPAFLPPQHLFLLLSTPMDKGIQNVMEEEESEMIMPTPLSTVRHQSDLQGHRKPSHICERVGYA